MKKLNLKILFIFLMFICINKGYSQWTVKHQSSNIGSPLYNYKSVINNKVYLVSTPAGLNYYVYEYDPVANNYIQKTISTIGFGSLSFTLNNRMFTVDVGASNNATRAYDPITDSWNTKDNAGSLLTILTNIYPPSNYGIIINASMFTFSINNDAYIGGLTMMDLSTNTQFISPYLFKYNITSDSYSPTLINNMPSLYNIIEPTTFVINQKAYVTGTLSDPATPSGSNGIFEVDLTSNNLIQKTFCTSCNEIRHASFVLNNKAYFNKRMDFVNCEKDVPILIYNPATDNWAMGDSIIQTDTTSLGLGFSVNNKGYFGYGTKWSGTSCQNSQAHSILYEYEMLSTDQEELVLNKHFNIYPNPTNNLINVSITNLTTAINFTLTSIDGKVVYQANNINDNNVVIDIRNNSKGIYFLKVASNSTQQIFKVIKK